MTIYVLKKDGEIVFENNNTACFAEITSGGARSLKSLDFATHSLEFLVDTNVSIETARKFVSRCKPWGIIASIEEVSKEDLLKWHEQPRGTNAKCVIKFSDYKTPNYLKFAIHVLRSMIEDTPVVNGFIDNPKPKGMQNWQFFRIHASMFRGGHGYFSGLLQNHYDGRIRFSKDNPRFSDIRDKIDKLDFANVTQDSVRVFGPYVTAQKPEETQVETLIRITQEYNQNNKKK